MSYNENWYISSPVSAVRKNKAESFQTISVSWFRILKENRLKAKKTPLQSLLYCCGSSECLHNPHAVRKIRGGHFNVLWPH